MSERRQPKKISGYTGYAMLAMTALGVFGSIHESNQVEHIDQEIEALVAEEDRLLGSTEHPDSAAIVDINTDIHEKEDERNVHAVTSAALLGGSIALWSIALPVALFQAANRQNARDAALRHSTPSQ